MAADLEIDIGKSLDNLIKLNEQGEKLAKTLIEAANAMSSASGKGSAAKNTNDFANAVNQLNAAQSKATIITKTVNEFNAAEYEARQRLKMSIDAQKKAINEKIKLDSVEANSMTALGIQYARNTAYLNGMSKEWRETTEEGKRFVSETNEMREKMMSMNESIGNHTLSVGNYAKGTKQLNASVGQILREMPNAAMSANLFFMAISNNLSYLGDSIAGIKAQNAELRAQGQSTVPVWKQVASSFFGWNAVMMVGITMLTQYGGAIVSWIGKLFKAKEALNQARMMQDKFNESNKNSVNNAQSEITRLQLLYNAATDVNRSYKERNAAVNELQSTYPSYFANMSTEQIMAGKAADSYNRLTAAILASSRAKAYEQSIIENEKQILLLIDEKTRLLIKQEKIQKKIAYYEELTKTSGANWGVSLRQAGAELKSNGEELDLLRGKIAALRATNQRFAKDISIIDLLFGDKNTGAGKKTTDKVKSEINIRALLYKKELEEMQVYFNNRIKKEAKNEEDVKNIKEQYRRAAYFITKKYLEGEIDLLEKQAKQLKNGSGEQVKILEQIAEYKAQISNESTELWLLGLNKEKEKTKTAYDDILKLTEKFGDKMAKALTPPESFEQKLYNFTNKWGEAISKLASEISDIGTTQYENSISNLEAETKAVEKEKEDQLSLVEGNSEKEAAVEAAYNAKIDALNKKKAQQEYKLQLWQQKMSALQAAINTALAVTKFLSKGDVAEAIAAGVLGAIEVGIILSKKISPPALAKGTRDAKEGIYRVGEAGRELADINGKTVLFDKETITYLPEHAKVYSNAETEKILKNPFVYPQTFTSDVKGNEMVNQLVGLRKDIRGLRAKRPVVNVYNLNNNSNLKRMFK